MEARKWSFVIQHLNCKGLKVKAPDQGERSIAQQLSNMSFLSHKFDDNL